MRVKVRLRVRAPERCNVRFDTIPHDRLLAQLQAPVADGRVLALVKSFIRAGVLEEAKGWRNYISSRWTTKWRRRGQCPILRSAAL